MAADAAAAVSGESPATVVLPICAGALAPGIACTGLSRTCGTGKFTGLAARGGACVTAAIIAA
ncbi:MAG: hypothetical protein ACRD2F_11985 [Terriglobales bacterium]